MGTSSLSCFCLDCPLENGSCDLDRFLVWLGFLLIGSSAIDTSEEQDIMAFSRVFSVLNRFSSVRIGRVASQIAPIASVRFPRMTIYALSASAIYMVHCIKRKKTY